MAVVENPEIPEIRSLDPVLLDKIMKRIVEAYDPARVILFGSYPGGQPTHESDIDLLVVTREPIDIQEQQGKRLGLYRLTRIPVQIITISQEKFEETRDVIGGIAYPAAKYGTVVYERS